MLPLWTDNLACKSKAHCPTCRKRESGRLWRERLRNAFSIPETDFECPHGEAWRAEDAPMIPTVPVPLPREKWPLLARSVARLAKPGETGVGDTLARMIEGVGGDTLAEWFERITGNDCGCADRAAQLNRLYPYSPTT